MNKKTLKSATFIFVFLFSTLVTGHVIYSVKANFSPQMPPMPETPDLNEPIVVFQAPENKTYTVDVVPLAVTIQKPSSWFDYNPIHGMIIAIYYKLDGKETDLGFDEVVDFNKLNFSFSRNLTGLPEGSHSIQIRVRSDSFYDPVPRPTSILKTPPSDYYIDTYSNKINFTIQIEPLVTSMPTLTPSLTPLPSTTASSTPSLTSSPTQQPTLEPTQAANPTLEPKNSLNSLPIITGTIIVIIVAVAGILVYFKKRGVKRE